MAEEIKEEVTAEVPREEGKEAEEREEEVKEREEEVQEREEVRRARKRWNKEARSELEEIKRLGKVRAGGRKGGWYLGGEESLRSYTRVLFRGISVRQHSWFYS